MTPISLLAAALLAIGTYFGAGLYRNWWRRAKPDNSTPTGFGAGLGLIFVIGMVCAGAHPSLLAAGGLIVASAALYWIDDFSGLGVKLRIAVQFCVGAGVVAIILGPALYKTPALLAVIVLGGAGFNVVLTNILNFYDGADLNLALVAALVAVMLLVFGGGGAFIAISALLVLAFILPFGLINRRPKTLYLGDAGAFALACFITMVAAVELRTRGELNLLGALPLALPAVDVGFVFFLRIARGEDLLTRNYHHLYQRLQIERGGFAYLWPQAINVLLCAGAVLMLRRLGVHGLLPAAVMAAVVSLANYALLRWTLLKPQIQ